MYVLTQIGYYAILVGIYSFARQSSAVCLSPPAAALTQPCAGAVPQWVQGPPLLLGFSHFHHTQQPHIYHHFLSLCLLSKTPSDS
jgi:hypothetical protein